MLFSKNVCTGAVLFLGFLIAGCVDNPGTWPMDKLTAHVKESLVKDGLEVTELQLTPKDGGGFDGTGTVAGGETIKLVVTQDASAKRISWDATGDRGSFYSGSYELK